MTEKSEKYRALRELIEDQSKAELFGNNSLFGNFHGDHSVLIQFVNYLDGIKKEYRHIPTTVSSKTFADYLSHEAKEKENSAEIIRKIDSLRTRGFIVDEPAAKNTFLNFALVLDDLGIIENEKLISVNYDTAVEQAINLKPATKEENTAGPIGRGGRYETGTPESPGKEGTDEAKSGTGTASDFNAETARKTAESSSPKSVIDSEESAPDSGDGSTDTEESADISIDNESRNEEANIFSRLVKRNVPGKITEENNSINEGLEADAAKALPQIPDSSKNNLDGSAHHSLRKPTPKELFREEADLIESLKNPEAGLELRHKATEPESNDDFSFLQDGSPAFPRKSGNRKIRRSGDGLRKLTSKPERLREPAQSPGRHAGQNSEYQQNNRQNVVSPGGQSPEQTMTPERSTESGGNSVRRSTGSNLGKKLAKLAGISVAGGTFLPLFAGGSAEAAAVNMAKDILTFVSRLLS